MTSLRRTLSLLTTAPLVAFVIAGCGSGEPTAQGTGSAGGSVEKPQPVTGGQTRIVFDGAAAQALRLAGVDVTPVGDARRNGDAYVFPITGGRLDIDTLSGRIEHSGGLRFSAAGRSVRATDLVVDAGRDVVTADVDGMRVPLFGLDLGRPRTVPASKSIVVRGSATLGKAIGDRLGVKGLQQRLRIGRIEISAKS